MGQEDSLPVFFLLLFFFGFSLLFCLEQGLFFFLFFVSLELGCALEQGPVGEMSSGLPFFTILPHPKAPVFNSSSPAEARRILAELISEVGGSQTLSAEALDLLRQAGLVNLYFFTKYILGSYEHVSYLNDGLQLDVCNWRQSEACMRPHARAAFALFRGSGKTDITTVSAGKWELTRNPDLAIGIVNSKVDRAATFTGSILDTFLHNELYKLLWPANCKFPSKVSGAEFTLPSRVKLRKEPSVKALGCTGSTEGDRFDLLDADDLIGLDDLSLDDTSAATMFRKERWFLASEKANLADLTSRYIMQFTTFGAEGLYSKVFKNLASVEGSILDEYFPGGERIWSLYIRDVIENGRPTLPEVHTEASLESLRRESPSLYYSQYRMRPTEGGLLEFKDLPVGRARLLVREVAENVREFFVEFSAEEKARLGKIVTERGGLAPRWPEETEIVPLGEMDVYGGVDPAGTSREDATSRSCKSALEVWARDSRERNVLVLEKAGFFSPVEFFEKIHEAVVFLGGALPKIGVEKAAMQKIIRPLLEKERNVFWKNAWVSFRDLDAGGDKDGRIRFMLGPLGARGLLWVCEGTGREFLDELALFPAAKYKKDALDASEKALRELRTPETEEEAEERETQAALAVGDGRSPVTGY